MTERGIAFRRKPTVASRTVDGQAVVIVMGGETLHSFNASGTWLWDTCCDGTFDADTLSERLRERYGLAPEDARRDVDAFLKSLAQVGAIEEVES